MSCSILELRLFSTFLTFSSHMFIRFFLLLLCSTSVFSYSADEPYEYDEDDPLSIGGGTQQTCDACRTVMDQLLQEWHTIDNDSFLNAINEAGLKKEYVPVVPEEEVAFVLMVGLTILEGTKRV